MDFFEAPTWPAVRALYGWRPFDVTLNLFGSRILDTALENEVAFDEGVTNAARFLLNAMVNGYYYYGTHIEPAFDDIFFDVTENQPVPGETDTTASNDLNDYGTNNQEDGVEEGDLIVSDGNYGKSCWL